MFAELETVISPTTILATNTSALSVTAMAADLQHPERVVGLHFFNPVAAMPLVEVVQAERTSLEALATGVRRRGQAAQDRGARRRPARASSSTGCSSCSLGVIVDAVENGTPVEVADRALRPLGLPMPPFELFDLVGPAVGLHVLTSLREDLGDRFPRSPGLEKLVADGTRVVLPAPAKGLPKPVDPAIQAVFDASARHGDAPLDEAGVLDSVLTALTVEVGHMLDEGVVATPAADRPRA